MGRFALGVLAAAAVAAIAFAGRPSAGASVPRVTPTPVALQYEKIDRVIMPTSTPPAPGTFQDDRAAIVVAGNGAPPQHHGLFGNVMNAYQGAMTAMQSFRSGVLTRYTYYNNWVRTDDIVHQTATITKCDLHQYITLDLAHRTYTIADALPSPAPQAMPMGRPGPPQVENEAPGTVDLTISARGTNLGPRTIEGIGTHGNASQVAVTLANATGSCSNSSTQMRIVEYVSGIEIPRQYCPLPRTSGAAGGPETIVHGGCKPRIHGDLSAAAAAGFGASSASRLAMYRLVTFGVSRQEMNTAEEAGNVRWLYRPEAEQLFSIPAGFTQQSP